MSVSKHMMKGLLDGALLGLISQGETYGYEILDNLKAHQFPEINFGSIYPVLLRLDKKGYVSTVSKNQIMAAPEENIIQLRNQECRSSHNLNINGNNSTKE